MQYLPVSKEDMEYRGWNELDFIIVTGDAYVDHPSFGTAIIGRILENAGYRVGIIPQPNWKSTDDFNKLGKPRLAFLVNSGCIDSMVNHYSVAKKPRQKDVYSPNGKIGLRPDRATIVYPNKIRELYKDVPIIVGGIEASLRRLSHYDYWDNKVRRSILLDSGADMLSYGMGEHQTIEIAEALDSGIDIKDLTFIKGTVYKVKNIENVYDYIQLPSYKEVMQSKKRYAESFIIQYNNTDPITAKTLVEKYDDCYIIQNPPSPTLKRSELDSVYSLNFIRNYHNMYEIDGGIPAIEEVKFSITSNRGCFGNCSFCALAFHQGRVLQSRSHASIISEAEKITWESDFKGYIHDVGGPTANFRDTACDKQLEHGVCKDKQCLFPTPCKQLKIDHKDYLELLRKMRKIPKIKRVFIRSGIRYDYLIYDKNEEFFEELCKYHISGQLKVAPEHVSSRVLEKMGKPSKEVYDRFVKRYNQINENLGMKQYIVPYLMSSHPGSDINAAVELAEYLRDMGHMPEQVQDFYPTPGTLSTCMYYTGIDPRTMTEVYVPKSPHEKAMQRALMQYKKPQNYDLVYEALKRANRMDLIGFDKKCLIRPRKIKNDFEQKTYKSKNVLVNEQKKKTIRNTHKKKK